MRRLFIFLVLFLPGILFSVEAHLVAPKGWECIRDSQQLPQKVKCLYVGTAKGQFSPSINIACEETTLGLEEYTNQAKTYHECQKESVCKKLGKMQTKMGPAEVLQIDRPTQWGNVRFIQAIVLLNTSAFVVTATCLQDDFSTLSSQLFKSIQSLHLE